MSSRPGVGESVALFPEIVAKAEKNSYSHTIQTHWHSRVQLCHQVKASLFNQGLQLSLSVLSRQLLGTNCYLVLHLYICPHRHEHVCLHDQVGRKCDYLVSEIAGQAVKVSKFHQDSWHSLSVQSWQLLGFSCHSVNFVALQMSTQHAG